MRCPKCGRSCQLVEARSILDLPDDPSVCVYAKWNRDGIDEDGGICIGSRRKDFE